MVLGILSDKRVVGISAIVGGAAHVFGNTLFSFLGSAFRSIQIVAGIILLLAGAAMLMKK